jgi:hypothetical protein
MKDECFEWYFGEGYNKAIDDVEEEIKKFNRCFANRNSRTKIYKINEVKLLQLLKKLKKKLTEQKPSKEELK